MDSGSSGLTVSSARAKGGAGRRGLAIALSMGVHALILAAVVASIRAPSAVVRSPPVDLAILPPVTEPSPEPSAPARRGSARAASRPTPAPAAMTPVAVTPRHAVTSAPATPAAPAGSGFDVALGEGELAGAELAGSGASSGGVCDMGVRLREALRGDPRVAAAVAALAAGGGGRAFRIWNGDWVAQSGEDGLGLATVREAVAWTVGFAPAACREAVRRGLVLIPVGSPSGEVRLAIGAARLWRWSELTGLADRRPPSDG